MTAKAFSATGNVLERPDAILFDLDGTLLDTAADIALALSRAMGERGHPSPEVAGVRQMIGRGAPMLVERAVVALGLGLEAAEKAALVEGFFHHYGRLQAVDEVTARPYDGVREALSALHAAGMPMAVVTNKQQRFAEGLLRRLEMAAWMRLVVGGDTCERRKPDPLPLQWACGQLGVAPSRTLMVGDSVNDVQAARAAGMPVVCVPYGYNEGADPRTLPCDLLLENLMELPRRIGLC